MSSGGGGKPKTPEPAAAERALARDSARSWNDYVQRFIPVENQFLEQTQATPGRIAAAKGLLNTELARSYSEAAGSAVSGLAFQGAALSSGRGALGMHSLGRAYAGATGVGQAEAGQAVRDRQQAGRMMMASFGRDMQSDGVASLSGMARQSTDSAITRLGQQVDRRNMIMGTAAGFAGIAVGGMRGADGTPLWQTRSLGGRD